MSFNATEVSQKVLCFKCEKDIRLYNILEEDDYSPHPSGGLHFYTYGHYGSSIFDMSPGQINIVICDNCILDHLDTAVQVTPEVRKGLDIQKDYRDNCVHVMSGDYSDFAPFSEIGYSSNYAIVRPELFMKWLVSKFPEYKGKEFGEWIDNVVWAEDKPDQKYEFEDNKNHIPRNTIIG